MEFRKHGGDYLAHSRGGRRWWIWSVCSGWRMEFRDPADADSTFAGTFGTLRAAQAEASRPTGRDRGRALPDPGPSARADPPLDFGLQPLELPTLGVSVTEAARILDLHQTSVRRYVRQGLLQRTSPQYGLDRDEVERLALERWRPGHAYWIGTPEAAEVLGVTTARLKRLAGAGRLPTLRYDGRWFFRRHQLEVIAHAREARLLAR